MLTQACCVGHPCSAPAEVSFNSHTCARRLPFGQDPSAAAAQDHMTSLPNYGLIGLDSKGLLDSLAAVPVANRQALLSSSLGSLPGGWPSMR